MSPTFVESGDPNGIRTRVITTVVHHSPTKSDFEQFTKSQTTLGIPEGSYIMAFLWKHPQSKYFMARFIDASGKRRNRSTRSTQKKEAQKIADTFEKAAQKNNTIRQLRKVVSELHKEISGEEIPAQTVKEFSNLWLTLKRKRHTPEEIIKKPREAATLLAGGQSLEDVCKKLEVSPPTYHRWKQEYGEAKEETVKRLKELEK